MANSKKSASRRRFWVRHVSAWRRSGLNRAAYAREYGFHPETFSRWVRLLGFGEKAMPSEADSANGQVGSSVQFVGVAEELITRAVPPATVRRSPGVSIVVARRFRIILSDGFSPSTLADVIRTLEGLG